jgi:tRNA A-37 threonylcarbamoyl transferase component Bud32
MDDRKNERFGRYEILSELGRGAMGIVYKARDPKINRVVAVKTISLSGQPPEEEKEYRERFYREAEAAGRLSHAGIVTVFDVGEEPETHAPYIVMEFVSGQSLEKLLLSRADHRLPSEAALQVTLELAEALDCAHGQGVVHRDLKPANILVTEEGHVKIADFGVAKLNLANATLAGRTLGTPAFMSPEQLNGAPVDGRSDLFSLGVILYTVLTGYRPFQGNSVLTVAFKVVNRDPIPASVLDTDLPPGLDYIISRAIAKDPAQRYQRGMEMVLDIQELQQGREPWSKAKHPDSAGLAGQPAHENKQATGSTALGSAAKLRTQHAATGQRKAAENMLEKMRGNAFAGAFLLIGLVVFGLRMKTFFAPPETPAETVNIAKTVTPPSPAPEAAPAKAETIPAKAPRAVSGGPTHRTSASALRHPAITKVSSETATANPAAPAMLEVQVDHKFAEAQLSIWVDDRLTYTRALEGTDKKRLAVFHHVEGHEFHAVQIPPGPHLLRVQVVSGANSPEHSATVQGQFESGSEKLLQIQFSKSGEMKLNLQ